MKEIADLKQQLCLDAVSLIEKRRARLAKRHFVLFPWLRIKWLMRKYSQVEKLLGVKGA